ncbi:MAG: RNA polymerase sigma factor [Dehalococcoidia bacterium]|nr:RNA polymerase sigma factor [Dehalococcoidia bacterium]MDZ4247037.1 RNA polymerase sigma factor [Dehalococcoidia bacterium]
MNDSEAVSECQAGNREAFRHLVENYKDILFGTAILMTGNNAIAEDMVQEAFISAWKGINRFQNGRPVKPWLVKILVNKVLSNRRRGEPYKISLDDNIGGNQSGPGLAEEFEVKDEVGRALDKLSEEHRQVVILRYFSELSLEEISAAMGCRQGTVKSRLHRAQGILRELLIEGNQ